MDMGVRGAAIATVLSQTAAAIAVIYYAYRHVPFMRIERAKFKLSTPLLKEMVRIGLPSGLQGSFISIGNMALQSLINGFGSSVVAAYTAASRIDSLTYQPGIAFEQLLRCLLVRTSVLGKLTAFAKVFGRELK